MAITLQRRKVNNETEAAIARLQEFAREQAERLGPYADQARHTAAHGFRQARGWTAPRLETAADRVEDTVAPRVADLLNAAAQRVDPRPVKQGWISLKRGGRRRPRAAVILGASAVTAAAVYGALRLRQMTQEAEWQNNLNNAREQVRETKGQLATKAKETQHRLRSMGRKTTEEEAEAESGPESTSELNGRVTS
ncbi:hypothetical protein [Salinactinospora qingdaonensis]|uniref:DUF3618 domain-containing protein n=1 Tax=Salinactinospora qingdaonensis TaxID=702744 RepID=A0ABP7FH80_9ACTN